MTKINIKTSTSAPLTFEDLYEGDWFRLIEDDLEISLEDLYVKTPETNPPQSDGIRNALNLTRGGFTFFARHIKVRRAIEADVEVTEWA